MSFRRDLGTTCDDPRRDFSGRRVRQSHRFVAATFLLTLVFLGCEFTPPGPPWEYPTTSVAGRISLSGQPAQGGWVTLQPIEGTVGDHVVGSVGPDGRFSMEEVPIGPLQVKVRLTSEQMEQVEFRAPQLLERLVLLAGPSSPLRLKSVAGEVVVFDFDLTRSSLPPPSVR